MSAKWIEVDDDGRSLARFDFEVETIALEERTGTTTLVLRPDRRRYVTEIVNSEVFYRDKFLNTLIAEREVWRMAEQQRALGLPLSQNPVSIRSAPNYAEDRKSALEAELSGAPYALPGETATPHREIGIANGSRLVSFLSLDICGSSALRRADPALFDRAHSLLIRELATVVGQFNASILKLTGDGFIAFNDFPAFTSQCDAIIDLGLSLVVVLRESINPALRSAGLPELAVRVGADYGAASIREVRVPTTGMFTSEVASDALNRAVKIEQSASPNELRIGRSLYELLHVQWLERCAQVEFDGAAVGLDDYEVFRVM